MENQGKLASFRLSKLFFYFLVFLIPLGTREIFYTRASFYYGTHIFYNSWYIYLTDLIFCGLILTWLYDISRETGFPKLFHNIRTAISQDILYRLFVGFWLIYAISITISREPSLGLFGLLKITQFLFLFAYIRENIRISPASPAGRRETPLILGLFLVSLALESVLAISQYFSQGWLGLWAFGEEIIYPGLKGAAQFLSAGLVNPYFTEIFPLVKPVSREIWVLRSYGTLPHPNVLGGLLSLGLMINLYLLHKISKVSVKIILTLGVILLSTALTLTFSRVAWFVTAFGIAAWLGFIFFQVRRLYIHGTRTGDYAQGTSIYHPGKIAVILIALLAAFGLNLFLFGQQIRDRAVSRGWESFESEQSVTERQYFNSAAAKMIWDYPILGVGARNFVMRLQDYSADRLLPRFLQPAHNIYLLIAAENGILALVIFLVAVAMIFLQFLRRPTADPVLKYTLASIFLGIMLVGFFDHYFWTIQQGSLAFWMTLGLLAAKRQ